MCNEDVKDQILCLLENVSSLKYNVYFTAIYSNAEDIPNEHCSATTTVIALTMSQLTSLCFDCILEVLLTECIVPSGMNLNITIVERMILFYKNVYEDYELIVQVLFKSNWNS